MATFGDLERFVEQNLEICDIGHPASDDLIDEAERFLQVRFPTEYREFLRRWGTLAIGPVEFYGITGKDFESSSVPNTTWFTDVKRKQIGLPQELVILSDNNGDEYYCLEAGQSGKSRVVVWDMHSRRVLSVKADSFFADRHGFWGACPPADMI